MQKNPIRIGKAVMAVPAQLKPKSQSVKENAAEPEMRSEPTRVRAIMMRRRSLSLKLLKPLGTPTLGVRTNSRQRDLPLDRTEVFSNPVAVLTGNSPK